MRTAAVARRAPWVALAVVTVLTAADFAVETATLRVAIPGVDERTFPWFTLFQPVLAAVGAVVASRRPRNPIGWIMVGSAVLGALSSAAHAYALWGLHLAPGTLSRPDVAAWLMEPIGDPGLALLLTFGLLLFPDGRLPSRRWRPVAWVAAGGIVLAWPRFFSPAFAPEAFPAVANPFAIHGEGWALALDAWSGITGFAWLATVLLAAASLVVRYRGAGPDQRRQIKWFVLGALLLAASLTAAFVLGLAVDGDHPVAVPLFLGSLGLLPVFMGIGIVRHNLFDIDRIVSRTVSYALLTALLAAVYATLVLAGGRLLGLADSPDWVVAVATLVVAALFRPLRARIQAGVDRRFNRSGYDAALVVERLGARLRDEVALESVAARLEIAAATALQPTSVSVWLRREEP